MVKESIKPKEPRLAPSFQHVPGFGTGSVATVKTLNAKRNELAALKAKLAGLKDEKPGPGEALMPEEIAAEREEAQLEKLAVLQAQIAKLKQEQKRTETVAVSLACAAAPIIAAHALCLGLGVGRCKMWQSRAAAALHVLFALTAAPCRKGARGCWSWRRRSATCQR